MSASTDREILASFDEERRTLSLPGYRREATANVCRSIPIEAGWACIDWSAHAPGELDRAIDEQVEYFTAIGCSFEWKVYDHDEPADLRSRLAARGFHVGPAEAFLVASIRELDLAETAEVEVRRMQSAGEFEDYLAVEHIMWPEDAHRARSESLQRFLNYSTADSYYVGYADGKPVACGRVTFRAGSRFAGLFGGATLEEFRGRRLYTALVAARAVEARNRGVDFLYSDALPTSRPILERRGFRCLSHTYPCTWRADQAS